MERRLGPSGSSGAISPGSVTSVQIADGTIVDADVSPAAGIVLSKLQTITPGHVVREVSSGTIGSAFIVTANIADNQITTNKIPADQIATAHIQANAISQANLVAGSTSNPTTTSSTPVAIPECAVGMTITGGPLVISFTGGFRHSVAGGTVALEIQIDGGLVGRRMEYNAPAANSTFVFALCFIATGVPAGPRTIQATWLQASGTATAYTTQRTLSVLELKR